MRPKMKIVITTNKQKTERRFLQKPYIIRDLDLVRYMKT